jgi:hypothetical protein
MSSTLTRQLALAAGAIAIAGMGALTACSTGTKEKPAETTAPSSAPSSNAPSPTEKAVGGGGNSVSISKIKLAFDGRDVVTDGTAVVTVELTQAVEDVGDVAAPIPKTSNGTAATIATRPVEARTQRATANPMTSNTNAAIAKPTVPPVSGNLHSSTAIMIHPACNRHHYGNKAIASKTVTDGNNQQLI